MEEMGGFAIATAMATTPIRPRTPNTDHAGHGIRKNAQNRHVSRGWVHLANQLDRWNASQP